ncbi:MAG TPA: lysylphosphatidylglycerol synthase transmembrane domain-containing protein [Anaerolineales bacterium]|nr:lysylphosphatidylglycerol synthase transmembrane domain-containing protein [Anaerolineales bacterium]
MKKFWNSTRRWLPGVLISLVVIVLVLWLVGPGRLVNAFRGADYRLILLALLTSWTWLAVRGIVWRTLLRNKASYKQVFSTLCEGYMLNNFLPLRLGELGRAFLLGRKASLPFMEVLSTIVIERALDVAFTVIVLLLSVPFVVGATSAKQLAILIGIVVVVGLVVLYWLARNPDRALGVFNRLTARWPKVQDLGGRFLAPLFSGLAILTDGWLFLRALLWMTLNWILGVAQFYITVLAFFPHAPFAWAMFGLSGAALAGAIPSAPGGVGVYEAGFVAALTLVSHDSASSLAIAIITHVFNYAMTGALGGYFLSTEGETLMSVYRQLRRRQEGDLPPARPS